MKHPSSNSTTRTVSIALAVAAVLAGNHSAFAQMSGAFTFSGNLGTGDSDALVGLDVNKNYVGKYSFGTGATNVTVNGVTFTAVAGTNPGVAGVFSSTGLVTSHAGQGAVPGGQLGVLTTAFVYGGAPTGVETFTYQNLVPGETYVVSYYSKAWDPGTRVQNMTAGGASVGGSFSYDQNAGAVIGNLNILRYTFQASSATQTVTFSPTIIGNTNHQYGFTLEQTFNNLWSTGTNWTTSSWVGGAATAPNSVGSNASFTAQPAPTTMNLDANRIVGHVQFDGANAWTLSSTNSSALTLQTDVGGAATLSTPTGSHSISTGITLASNLTMKLGAGNLAVSGVISGTGNRLHVAGGTLALSGANTFTGETIIGNGILEVNTVSDYGVASAIGARTLAEENNSLTGVGLHFQGGTLKFTGSTAQSTNRHIRILNGANGGTIDASGTTPAATLSFTKTGANINLFDTGGTRTLTLTGSNTGDNGFSILLANEGGNATSLTKSGVGTWVLNGTDANTATGATTVTNGTLKLGKTAVVAVSGNLSIGTGATSAVVQLGGTGGNQISDTSVATLAGSGATAGILRMNNLSETIAGLSSTGGAGIVENESGSAATGTLTLNVTGTQAYSGILRDGDGAGTDGTLALTKGGAGTQTLSGSNTYSGATILNGGVLSITNGSALGSTAAGVTQSGTSELRISGGITIGNEAISINGGGINNFGAIRNFADSNIYGGTLTLAGQSRIVSESGTLTFNNATSVTGTQNFIVSGAGDMVINGAINIGTGFLLKDGLIGGGTGTLTLGGANSYTGTTTVTAGTLRLDYLNQDNSKLSNTTALVLGGGTLDMVNGSHLEIVGSTTLNANTMNFLTRSSGGAVLELNNVAVGAGAILNIGADNIATTNNTNVGGLLLGFRRGNVWAVNSTNLADGPIVAFTAYNDVNRLGGVIPDGIGNNVRIIEAGATGNVTLLTSPTNIINSLQVDANGGPTIIAPTAATDTLVVGDVAGNIWHQATAGGLTIGTAPNDGILTSGNLPSATNAALNIINDSITNGVIVNSAIRNNGTDAVNVVKSGLGTVTFAGNNTFSNTLVVAGGTLILTGNNSGRPVTGLGGATTINNGATLQLQANAGNTTGSSTTVLSNEQTANQPFIISSGGTLQLRSDSTLTFLGGNNLGGVGTATVTFDVNQLTPGNTNNTLTFGPNGFNVNTTTVNVTGGNGYTFATGNINNVGPNAVLTLNPTTGSMKIGGYTANATFSTTLLLSGSAPGNSITGPVANPATSGATTVLKIGESTWTLNGADTYSAPLIVRAGTLNLSGNRTAAMNAITVSDTAGTNATLGITNGTYALGANNFFVGFAANTAATGTVNQSGGSVSFTSGNALLIGNSANPAVANTGIYNLSGGTITSYASTSKGILLGVNDNTIGTFNQSGGAINFTTASGATGEGSLLIGRWDSADGDGATVAYNQTGGTANIGILSIGGNGGSGTAINGRLTLSAGTFAANQFARLSAGNTNTSVITISGTADVTLPAFPTARGTGSTATVNFDGGTLRPLAPSAAYMGGLTNVFIKAGGAKFNVASGRDITVTQALLTDTVSTGGGFTKEGDGSMTLTATNTYTGPTIINAGTLLITGSITGSTSTVNAGGTLGGTGTLGPVNSVGGIIAPGVSVGTLNTGAFSVDSASVFKFQLGLPNVVAGLTNDLINVVGALTLDGTVQVTDSGGFDNGIYRLFNYSGTLTNNFLALEPAFEAAHPGSYVDYDTASQINLVVVPEPGAGLALLGGLGMLLGLRRRRSV